MRAAIVNSYTAHSPPAVERWQPSDTLPHCVELPFIYSDITVKVRHG